MPRSILPIAALLLAAPLTAQGWIDPTGPLRASPAVVRTSSDVRVTIEGRLARFEVTERFRNSGRGIAEGVYHYPLPAEAVFSDFSLFQGEQELRGEMMDAAQARAIYENIVRQLKDPALLTLVGHSLVRAQVFPIQPGETRTVVLRYSQMLPRDGDAMRIRYASGSRGDAPVTMSISASPASELATPYSPTHPITDTRRGNSLDIDIAAPVRGDVEVLLPSRRELIGGTVITHATAGEPGYAMLLLSPPPVATSTAVARDLTFVVDISGSMSGHKMQQARTALHQALASLRPTDRFRLIAFSSRVTSFREGWSPATSARIDEAGSFVDGLTPTGGTNIAAALDEALAAEDRSGRMSLIFFVTDGLPSVGEQQPDRIAANAAAQLGRHRVFTFGVGQDVNTYLLDRLAVEGRGSASYVAADADVADAVGTVLAKLSRPALVDLRIVSAPVALVDRAPAILPDLFFGEELVILARYTGSGSGPVIIEGTRDGRRERFTIAATFARREQGNRYVPQLWAARRIGELTRQLRIEGSTPELIATIRDLGLRHGILTEYTSYLVQEPDLLVNREERRRQPVAAPAPQQQTGARAFDAAKSSSTLSASNTVAEAELAMDVRAGQLGSSRVSSRRAGGRIFALKGGVWTDIAHADSIGTLAVAPFSKAYFDLVAARPALAGALTVDTPLVIAGQRRSLRIDDTGITTWPAGALETFLREFEGR